MKMPLALPPDQRRETRWLGELHVRVADENVGSRLFLDHAANAGEHLVRLFHADLTGDLTGMSRSRSRRHK